MEKLRSSANFEKVKCSYRVLNASNVFQNFLSDKFLQMWCILFISTSSTAAPYLHTEIEVYNLRVE